MTSDQTKKLFASIGKLITSSLDLNEILDGIMEEVHLYFSPENWSLMRYDRSSSTLFFVIVQGISYLDVEKIRLRPGEGIAGSVVQSGRPIFVPDTASDPRFSDRVDQATGFITRTIMAVPIKFKSTIYGVIEIINRTNGTPFTEDEYIILQTIADFSAIAFANHTTYAEAVYLSETDQLTGLYNRSRLESIIAEDSNDGSDNRRESDQNRRAIVVYMDLNSFKEVNDRYGHREGDEILKRVAMRLRSMFRSRDTIFRVGGDEFMVLILLKGSIEYQSVIKRIETSLSLFRIASMEKDYVVTLSYGICVGDRSEIEKLIDEADRNMFRDKSKRNDEA